MKKHIILLFLSPMILFAQNSYQGQPKYLPGASRYDSIPIEPAQISAIKNNVSITELWTGPELPLNKDSMIALFKNRAKDISLEITLSYINSAQPQGHHKTLGVGQDATYILMQVPYSAGARYSTSDDLIRWTKALHDDHYVDKTNSQKRRESRFGTQGLWIGN